MHLRLLYSLLFCSTLIWAGMLRTNVRTDKIKGISLVAPPRPFTTDPMEPLLHNGANWIALIPFAYASKENPKVRFGDLSWQWWGELPEGISESIRRAHAAHLNVMLKPQVYMHQYWVGSVKFDNEKDWNTWEKSYRTYILNYAKMAEQLQVEMFCIATEYDLAAVHREAFFRSLIKEVRSFYKGRLCYSSNWDHYAEIPFWDALDYIGLSAYFPLCEDLHPDLEKLKTAWRPFKDKLHSFSKTCKKPILFTEYGYLSVDGCAGKGWELERNIQGRNINQSAQAIAYQALFECFASEKWWAGGFLWKWFPNGEGHEGYPERDYTPQGKKAEHVLRTWYCERIK